jgi:hypothetical protein
MPDGATSSTGTTSWCADRSSGFVGVRSSRWATDSSLPSTDRPEQWDVRWLHVLRPVLSGSAFVPVSIPASANRGMTISVALLCTSVRDLLARSAGRGLGLPHGDRPGCRFRSSVLGAWGARAEGRARPLVALRRSRLRSGQRVRGSTLSARKPMNVSSALVAASPLWSRVVGNWGRIRGCVVPMNSTQML